MSWADQWEKKVKAEKFGAIIDKSLKEHAERVEHHKLKKALMAGQTKPRAAKKAAVSGEPPQDERLEVPKEKIGLLIGPRGETIRGLQATSGANIRVLKDGDLGASLDEGIQIVRLMGTSEQVLHARREIHLLFGITDARRALKERNNSVWARSRSRSRERSHRSRSSDKHKRKGSQSDKRDRKRRSAHRESRSSENRNNSDSSEREGKKRRKSHKKSRESRSSENRSSSDSRDREVKKQRKPRKKSRGRSGESEREEKKPKKAHKKESRRDIASPKPQQIRKDNTSESSSVPSGESDSSTDGESSESDNQNAKRTKVKDRH